MQVSPEISRFPCKELLRMPGSTTTSGCVRSHDNERAHIAFHVSQRVSAREDIFEAQWLACACPDRRFAVALAGADARLGVDMTRYVFIVRDSHSVFLAGFPGARDNYLGRLTTTILAG